jgi:hypothetical protein
LNYLVIYPVFRVGNKTTFVASEQETEAFRLPGSCGPTHSNKGCSALGVAPYPEELKMILHSLGAY